MVAEACYARFSLLLVGLAAGLALMGTLTAIMLVEELRRRKKEGLSWTLEIFFSLTLGGVGFWATQQVVSMAVTIVCEATGRHSVTTDAVGLCGSLAFVVVLMTIGLRVALRDKYFGVSKQKRITLLSKDIRRIARTRAKVKSSKLVEKRAMVANLGVIVWGGMLSGGGVLGMEYTSLRSLTVTGYTLVYLPVYMALAAVIGLIVLPVGFWLSLRVLQWRQKDEVLRRLTAVMLSCGAVAVHVVVMIGIKFVPDTSGDAQSTVRNPLPMHPGRATRWWVGVLLACVAVCMTTNYRMVLRERFDLTRVLDDIEDLGSIYTRLRSTQSMANEDGGYRSRVEAFLVKSAKFLEKHMQDYKEALALAAEKESRKTQPKPNGAATEKKEVEEDKGQALKRKKSERAAKKAEKAAEKDEEAAAGETDSFDSHKKPAIQLGADSPALSEVYARKAPKGQGERKISSRTSSQKPINSPTDYELQLQLRSTSGGGKGRGGLALGLARSDEESEGSSSHSSDEEGGLASASSGFESYMAPPANHRAILNMLLGVSVDLSRSDFMRTEVLRRAEVADARGPGLPVPDSEFGSYESWGQPGSTSVGPQTRRDESSTQSPNISLSEIAAINNRFNLERQQTDKQMTRPQTEQSPSDGTGSLPSLSPGTTPLSAREGSGGVEGTSLRVPALQLPPEQRHISVTALPSVTEGRQVKWGKDLQHSKLPPALETITPRVVGNSPRLFGGAGNIMSPRIVGNSPRDGTFPPSAAPLTQQTTSGDSSVVSKSPSKKDATPRSASPAPGEKDRQAATHTRAGLEEGEEFVVRIKLVGPNTVRVASCVFGEDGEANDEVTTLLEGEAAAALMAGLRGDPARRNKKAHRHRHSGPTEPAGVPCKRRSNSSHGSCSSGHKCEAKEGLNDDLDVQNLVVGQLKTWEQTKLLDGLMQFSPGARTAKEGQPGRIAGASAKRLLTRRGPSERVGSESSRESSGEKGGPLTRMARFAVGALSRSNTNGAVLVLSRTRGVQPDSPEAAHSRPLPGQQDATSAPAPEFPTHLADEAAMPPFSHPSPSVSHVSSISSP